jgi:hypothetical protein
MEKDINNSGDAPPPQTKTSTEPLQIIRTVAGNVMTATFIEPKDQSVVIIIQLFNQNPGSGDYADMVHRLARPASVTPAQVQQQFVPAQPTASAPEDALGNWEKNQEQSIPGWQTASNEISDAGTSFKIPREDLFHRFILDVRSRAVKLDERLSRDEALNRAFVEWFSLKVYESTKQILAVAADNPKTRTVRIFACRKLVRAAAEVLSAIDRKFEVTGEIPRRAILSDETDWLVDEATATSIGFENRSTFGYEPHVVLQPLVKISLELIQPGVVA